MTMKLTFKESKGNRSAVLPIAAKAAIGLLPLVSALPAVAQTAANENVVAKDTIRGNPSCITETKTVKVGSDAGPFGKITKIDAGGLNSPTAHSVGVL